MIRRFLKLALIVSFSAPLVLMGCGDDGGDGDADGGNGNGDGGGGADSAPAPDAEPALTGIDKLCDEDEGIFVDFFNKFIGCNPFADFVFGDINDALLSEACYGQFGDYVDDGSTVIDDDELDDCAAWIAATECNFLDIDRATECDAAIVGQIAVGNDCDIDDQCAGDAYCDGGVQNGGPSCGTCTNTLANGMSCDDPSMCSSGHCSNTDVCANIGDVGDACDLGDAQDDEDDNNDCLGLLECNDSNMMCEEPPDWAVDDACDDQAEIFGECGYPFSNLYCNSGTDQCTAVPAVGEACDNAPVLIPCSIFEYEWCDLSGTGNCAGPNTVNTEGLTCNIGFFDDPTNECAAGMACSTFDSDMNGPLGVCYVPREEGETCNNDDQQCLPLLNCVDGTCAYNEYSGMCPAP